jgi:acetylornithine deacetylase/succinyl-diaminopimelate desuccinylase-like protein
MENTIDILKTIISIPSYVNKQNNEKNLIAYIKSFVHTNAPFLKVEEQHVEDNRSNLIITGPEKVSTVLFGHMDTVLPKEETDQPFTPRIEGNKLFGLGSVDMKAGIAIILDIIKNHHKKGVGYVFTVDEEYEFKGGLKLKDTFNLNPSLIINVEPTSFKVLNGCRGITEFNFVVNGKSVHAGLKKYGINAIEKGVELVNLFQKEISKFDSEVRGASSVNLSYIKGGMLQGKNPDGSPIISELGMVVPNYAYLNCEIRIASDKISKEYITEKLKKIGAEAGRIDYRY